MTGSPHPDPTAGQSSLLHELGNDIAAVRVWAELVVEMTEGYVRDVAARMAARAEAAETAVHLLAGHAVVEPSEPVFERD